MSVSRRTVTVLFADVVDSTPLGEELDPEALRRVMTDWYDRARTAIERYGGTVEKYIGDAVMAVFGLPEAHEDDAHRAVRAALELREHAPASVRIGINTGEVVAGDASARHGFVSGDAVNTAKRIEEAARGSEILVGEQTERLVRSTVLLEPVDPLVAKGKTAPVAAWRVLAAIQGMPAIARRLDTPLVGRDDELTRLRQAFERAVQERVCCLFTLLGPAGIGKSRLASELFDDVGDDATVLIGRCLPYGDGITFWPLTEIFRDLSDEEALAALLGDDAALVYERLCSITGRTPSASTQETFWAVRRVVEALARERPLVLCFEDVHWAEPTMLDLIEYLAGWIRDAPILLLCIARPEFLDERPAWLSGQEHASSLTLHPLSLDEADALLEMLGTADAQRARIAEAAEGNPLYVEQMAAMVADTGSVDEIPPTIQALLAARLDRLTQGERATIERAAIAGKEFWRDAIVHLTPEHARADVGRELMSLVRKELIRPWSSTARADDGLRFAHALVRDAAYSGVPKEVRAQLHAAFAEWLERDTGATDGAELVGYHLEQAFRYHAELAPMDASAKALGERAATLLGSAGHRALGRSDIPAAVNLLGRSVSLHEAAGESVAPQLLLDLGTALRDSGDLARADATLAAAVEAAEAPHETTQAERARIERLALHLRVDPGFDIAAADERARAAIETFTEADDDVGLAKAWRVVADIQWARLRLKEMETSLEQALVHARRAGDEREASEIVQGLCRIALLGPTHVDEAIRRCLETLERERDDLALEAGVHEVLAVLLAAKAQFDEARELLDRARHSYDELGLGLRAGAMYVAFVELLAGNAAAAEAALRRAYEDLRAIGEHAELSTTAALLALVLCALDRVDEADGFVALAEESVWTGDIASHVIARRARAKILAAAGDLPAAVDVAHDAVDLAETTDWLQLRADTLLDLAELESALGDAEAAGHSVQRAIALYEAKGIDAAADRARAHFSQLAGA